MNPIWDKFIDRVLNARQVELSWDPYDGYTYYDFLERRLERVSELMNHANLPNTEYGSPDARWKQERFASVIFSVYSLFVHDSALDFMKLAFESVFAHRARLKYCLCFVGFYYDGFQEWEEVRLVALAWIRALIATRQIQRAWRKSKLSQNARFIQTRWRFLISNPRFELCKRRLLREFNEY